MAAGGADEAVGPAPGGEMPGTGGFIGKARLEGGAGHRAVIVPAAGHHGTLHEQAADAHQKLNISSNRAQRDKPFSLIGTRKKIHLEVLARTTPQTRLQRSYIMPQTNLMACIQKFEREVLCNRYFVKRC